METLMALISLASDHSSGVQLWNLARYSYAGTSLPVPGLQSIYIETIVTILKLLWDYHENIVNIFETLVKPCLIFLFWRLVASCRSSIELYRNYCDNFETIVRLSWKSCENTWKSCETLVDILMLVPVVAKLCPTKLYMSKLYWNHCETIMNI